MKEDTGISGEAKSGLSVHLKFGSTVGATLATPAIGGMR
jgi:hypothetical protein